MSDLSKRSITRRMTRPNAVKALAKIRKELHNIIDANPAIERFALDGDTSELKARINVMLCRIYSFWEMGGNVTIDQSGKDREAIWGTQNNK